MLRQLRIGHLVRLGLSLPLFAVDAAPSLASTLRATAAVPYGVQGWYTATDAPAIHSGDADVLGAGEPTRGGFAEDG